MSEKIDFKLYVELFVMYTISVVIFVLDVNIKSAISENASISLSQISDEYSFLVSFFFGIFLNPFFIIFYLDFIFKNRSPLKIHSLYLIFMLIKEAVMFKFFTCFNYINTSLLIARSCFNLLFLIITVISQLERIYSKQPNRSENWKFSFSDKLSITASTISILAIFIFNVLLLVLLNKPLKFVMNASNINIGYFDQSEVNAIKNNKYVIDEFFEQRVIGTLNDIVNSKTKTLLHCTRDICTPTYLHTVSFYLNFF